MAIANITNNILTDSGTLLSSLQPTITLTTTGTSGAATLISNTLNIPQYTGGSGTGTSGTSGTSGVSGGGGGTPGGADTQIQFNDASSFGGSANFTWNKTSNKLTVGGSQTAATGIAQSTIINPTLVAAANNDSLYALDISPTFTNGAFTGVTNNYLRLGSSGTFSTIGGNTFVIQSLLTFANFYGKSDNTGGFAFYGGGAYNTGSGINVWGNTSGGSANTIQFLRNGYVESGRFDASGNFALGTLTIGSKFQVNGNAAIGYNASTAGPTNGLQVAGNIYSAGTGSTTTTPREVGISNFVATNAARFTFGDSANCIQNANGGMMQIVSYHAMQIYGGRLGTAVNFITSVPTTDPSLNIIGSVTTRPTLVVTPVVSQTANTQEWRNSSGTALSVVTPSGTFGLLTTTVGSTLQVNGNAAIGYSASTAAPTNGLAVSGQVGIGKTSTVQALDVVGNFFLRNSSGAGGTGYAVEFATDSSSPRVNFVVNASYVGEFSCTTTDVQFKNTLGAGGGISFITFSNAERAKITSLGEFQLKPAVNTIALSSSTYSLTGANAQSLLELSGTWNTTGNPTAIKLNITNTASGAAADLMELQVGSVTQFKVDKVGIVTANTIVKSGGTGAQYLMADGTVTTSTGTGTSGTSGTTGTSGVNGANGTGAPVGANTQIQFYDVSTFGGSPNLTWDKTINKLSVVGDVNITGVLSQYVVTNRQTASYTLALSDNGKLVEMNVATANNLTVPLNSSISFPIGTEINIVQYGAGQTTVVATGGVTIRSTNSWLKLNSQYGAATLIKIGTDEWYLFGNINA